MQSLINKLTRAFTQSAAVTPETFVPAKDTSKVYNPSTLDPNNAFTYAWVG